MSRRLFEKGREDTIRFGDTLEGRDRYELKSRSEDTPGYLDPSLSAKALAEVPGYCKAG